MKTTIHTFRFLLPFLFMFAQVVMAQMYTTFNGAQLVYGGGRINNILSNSVNINPAYLGAAPQTQTTFNLMQVGFNTNSNVLDRKDAMKFLFSKDSIAQISKDQMVQNLIANGGDMRLNGTLHINWISGSWIKEGFGGLSLNVSDHIAGVMQLDQNFAGTLFSDGQDLPNSNFNYNSPKPEQTSDSLSTEKPLNANILYNHTREVNISYGRAIYKGSTLKVFLGGSYRRLWGIGHFDSSIRDSIGSGSSSFSDFYTALGELSIDSLFSNKSKKLFDNSGKGQSFSAGLHLDYKDKLSFDVAAINLGQLKWNDNVQQVENAAVNPIDSLQTVDTYGVSDGVKDFTQLLPFAQGESFTTATQAEIRVNAAYHVTKGFCVYTDMLFPTRNQKRDYGYKPGYLLGVDLGIIPQQIHFSAGMYYNKTFGWRVPAGLAISMGNKAFLSITTGDLMTLVSKKVAPFTAISVSVIGVNF